MNKSDLQKWVSSLTAVEIENLLHIVSVECRERYYAEHPEECLYTTSELEQMKPYSKLAH
jgi:hypothetical protein